MKYLIQFMIISLLTFIAEVISMLIPLPIPAGIYGLVIMFICLCTRIIKLDQVENVADWLLQIMPVMFVPTTVNLITKWDIIKANLVGLIITCTVSTIITMGVTGLVAQLLLKKQRRRIDE